MKYLAKYNIFLALFLFVFSLSCSKDSDDESTGDDLITNSYSGWMDVFFSNTIPPFSASAKINVDIDKDLDMILFETGTLSYSGDTIMDGESRIERAGNWIIEPTGELEKAGTDVRINVDGGITIVSDIQKIYALVNGQWQLVNQLDFASTPNADIFFSLDDAVLTGSTVQVITATGSIRFTLHMVVVP